MPWITSRNRLSLEQRQNNAFLVASYLSGNGWSYNAIAGLLGNMEAESSINAGVVEGYVTTNPPDKGYGFIQWTDSHATSVYQNPLWQWTYRTYGDYNWDDPDRQLIFINGDDRAGWLPVSGYNMSYDEFKVSTEAPDYLARAYFYNRERGTWTESRATRALYWYEYITGETPPDPPDPPDPEKKKHKMPLYLYPAFRHL